MPALARDSVRRSLGALLCALLAAGVVGPVAPPDVAAAPPEAKQCQRGFLASKAPVVDERCAPSGQETVVAAAVPAGFQESVVWSGLTNPTTIRFAADGRVFVAEKSGVIKVFDSLSDLTPTSYSGLQTNVHNFWDRGLLGLALDPSLTGGTGSGSFVYVLYAYDHILGSTAAAPRWGDGCPNPPGSTTDGCVVSGRLSRLNVSGTTITGPEQVLIEDWCQQFPSHSIGGLTFGPDGALYVSSGDGASFTGVDYGQRGGTTSPIVTERNPCGDPPGGSMAPPSAEGGALRSQDLLGAGGGASPYRSIVLADTPLAYWRLGEPSGTAADDQVGSNDGTYVNAPTLGVTGIPGGADSAVRLTAVDQEYVNVPPLSAIPSPVSIEAWINSNGSPVSDVGIAGWYQSDTFKAALYWAATGEMRFSSTSVGNPPIIAGGLSQLSSGWHHVVGTFDGTNARLYVDGALVGGPTARTLAGGPSTTTFKVGQYGEAWGTYSNASFDEVAVYGHALSAADVAEHHAAGSSAAGADPVSLDGSVLRVDPSTGAGLPTNPFASSSDANARRIIAHGFRNPFRIAFRPGTSELWVGDVGWSTWEEINRIPNAQDGVAENFGWPCYEGNARQSGYDGVNLTLCEDLYGQGPSVVSGPLFTYNHANPIVADETCPRGGSSVTGLAFYPTSGGTFPAEYHGGLFFADHSRNCIWFLPKDASGVPDPTAPQRFLDPAAAPVDLAVGPNGDLFYVDFGGSIRRISWAGAGNLPPTAQINASPTSGPAPLTVSFDGTGSSDPELGALTYEWDLDGDGAYDDSNAATVQHTYTAPGNVTARLRVTDVAAASATDSEVISVANSPPVPVIETPTSSTTWKVGDALTFTGSATDPQDGNVPATSLSWSLVLQHCPASCHPHPLQTWTGVAGGTFNAPDHEYPSYLELTLTAVDSLGTSASVTRRLDPRVSTLTFQSSPSGLSIAVNAASSTTSFTRTVIVGSSNSVSATSPQTLNGSTYTFGSWSHGAAQSHQLIAPATNTTYTATFTESSISFLPTADAQVRSGQANKNFGTATVLRVRINQSRAYLQFVVSGLTGAPSSAKLRLWIADGGTSGGSIYPVSNSWTESGITWNNAPAIPGTALSSVSTATTGTFVEFDVSSAITGNGTYSFAISGGGTNAVDYASRETTNDPALIITR